LFADVQHRRFVLFALADHDDAVDVDLAEHLAHGVDRCLIDGIFIAAADELPGYDRSGFRRAKKFKLDTSVDAASRHALT
jgi:hypothetical protein